MSNNRIALPLVLNQYRTTSGYKDVVGQRYHFPSRYLKRFEVLPVPFVYYEPREGGDMVYFGTGVVRSVIPDTEDDHHFYADVDGYSAFTSVLNYYAGPNDKPWEDSKTMRNSVRSVSAELFAALLAAGHVNELNLGVARLDFYESKLAETWEIVKNSHEPLALRRKQRVLESYERPSWVTNHVKQLRGDTCQLCKCPGFKKRDGTRYCELHHLFHLAKNPPADALSPKFLVVLCATCHRRIHYANVGIPTQISNGWQITIDGQLFTFTTDSAVSKNSAIAS